MFISFQLGFPFLAAVDRESGEFLEFVICPGSAEHLIPCVQGRGVCSGPKATEMREFQTCAASSRVKFGKSTGEEPPVWLLQELLRALC